MKYKAVLFDLDGTLLDTIEDLSDSMNAALAELGSPSRTVAECKRFVGDGVRAFAERSLPQDRRDEKTVSQCIALARRHYASNWANKTQPYEGIPELLDALTQRGLKLAVLSNKPDDTTQLCVGKLLSNWRFEVVQGVCDGVEPKPDPSGAIGVAATLGVAPEQFLYVGDTNTDMLTANAAGMHAVGVLWGFRTAEELTNHGAAMLLGSPCDLIELLEQ